MHADGNFLLLEKVTAQIEAYRRLKVPDDQIFTYLQEDYGVTLWYVRAIMGGNLPEV